MSYLCVLRQNVLIDESFTAKVADFGFVNPLPNNVGSTAVVTAIGAIALAGTRGYTASEYAAGKRGPKTDVYMYGVHCKNKCVILTRIRVLFVSPNNTPYMCVSTCVCQCDM